MDEKKKEFEEELDRKLASDDFDDIADAVTPKGLGSCSTNTLLKSFEVSGYLRYQAHTDRPDVEELDKLANSVEEFTTCLIDPLKSDTKEREAFGETLDLIIDSAIKHKQEKKNSLRAWSFKRAVTIRTYRDYHPIPVPLNLLSQLFLALCRRKSNKYNDLLDNDSETRHCNDEC
ncbi:PREDICTED: uncharacterized protein LOC107328082 [Acropora digitifera]|uniref:uncharacterized protein LOC107328082 n=1 Tax=Acropora digitifera TaxID=70779 RepID=UPI00077AD0A0|nr:PREDICTED: uncharacterized protein LOC107328082 [Acropora digitifera]